MSLVYPAPTIVVGVGRFGIATLERLGDDWSSLRQAGADTSLQNLRLLAVRPASEALERHWRDHEKGVVSVARYLGEGDLPSLALDLVVLRSLGLVRYRDGVYEVAAPRDAGVVEVDVRPGDPADTGAGRRLLRRRYFDWIRLSPDPIVAAERLRALVQRRQELDVFVTPLLNRVKQGHSPQALLACIGRCRALQDGRDPTPWPWLREQGSELLAEGLRIDGLEARRIRTVGAAEWEGEQALVAARAAARDTEDQLVGVPLPPPLPLWQRWCGMEPGVHLDLRIPLWLRPQDSDLPAPLDAGTLLERDWETTGWASESGESGGVVFDLLPLSPLRLGLFDHDERTGVPADQLSPLPARLQLLAEHLHRGLVRLWVDLQWERVADLDEEGIGARQRDYLSDALQQSLEILGELVVRPLAPAAEGTSGPLGSPPERGSSEAESQLAGSPSGFLTGLTLEPEPIDGSCLAILARRLARLGLADPSETGVERRPLLEDVAMGPGCRSQTVFRAGCEEGGEGGATFGSLRGALNRQVRQLFDFSLLSRYRTRPTRRPPRLTVFVVGDMSEPFTREILRPVLREIHAELLRAFTPIFETYREGFDRCLCVTPILWTPHPADPFPGGDLVLNRCEEAAIIDGIHRIRRWVECVLPAGRRCIAQIFVNSRVTDTASLSLDDAVRQTRDFLSFQARSDLAADLWLRQTTAASGGSDLFASFSCYEIEFPALRSREYLANRLARECLAEIKAGPEVRLEAPGAFSPPPVSKLVAPAREALEALARDAAEASAQHVLGTCAPAESTSAEEIAAAFDERFERSLYRLIQDRWSELTGRQGRVDELVDELRLATSRLLSHELEQVLQYSDRLIEEHAGAGGMKAVQAGFHLLRACTRDSFHKEEELRRRSEALSLRHQIPDLSPLRRARLRVLAAGERKPDDEPLRMGLILWGLLCPLLGASVAHGLAYLLALDRRPGFFELLLGPGGALVGGLVLFVPAWMLGRWHLRLRLRRVQAAIEDLAAAVRRLMRGDGLPPDQESTPSIRSFLASRLELTGAVATRGFALRVLERTIADSKLAYRLTRSADIQLQGLARRSEDLGVRARQAAGGEERDDVSRLFLGRSGAVGGGLIDPEDLDAYYRDRVGRREDLPDRMRELIAAAGGFAHWRERACLADAERILSYCREQFEAIVSEPISEQHFFAAKVGHRLVQFVGRCYSNLGFGAAFKGYEGLDPDNVQVLADAALVVHPGLATAYHQARKVRGELPTTETMQVIPAGIRPNAAYMLSLVQGVRVHSMRNLRRFESFHARINLPEDRIFPLSHEQESLGTPLNPLTGYGDIATDLSQGVRAVPRGDSEADRA